MGHRLTSPPLFLPFELFCRVLSLQFREANIACVLLSLGVIVRGRYLTEHQEESEARACPGLTMLDPMG